MALAVVAGGAGAVLRYLVDTAVTTRIAGDGPWGTAVVNVTGSFVLGIVTALAIDGTVDEAVLAVAGTGFLGGYTTFSTASVETVQLALAGRHRAALAAGGLQLVTCVGAAAIGLAVGRLGT